MCHDIIALSEPLSPPLTLSPTAGILACRFGILWKPLRCPLARAPVVVEACMCLHNICIDRHVDQEIRPPLARRKRDVLQRPHINNNGGPSSLMTDHTASVGRDTNDMTALRVHITTQLRQLEVQRPSLLSERVAPQRLVD